MYTTYHVPHTAYSSLTSLLLRIGSASLLSFTSLLVILFRVSPLSSPTVAVPFFFLTLFLFSASTVTLIGLGSWQYVKIEGMDTGKKISIAFREGLFFATAITLVFLFQILGILTWWIIVLIFLVFILVEMALQS